MALRTVVAPAVIACALFISTSAWDLPTPQGGTNVVAVFAVSPANQDAPWAKLEAVVVIKGNALLVPPAYDHKQKEDGAAFRRFQRTYYAAGKIYPLLIGGSEGGTATVIEPTLLSCESLAAKVRLSASPSAGRMALSTTPVYRVRLHPDWQNTATAEQRSALKRIAAEYLKNKGEAPSPVEIEEAISTKLGESEPASVIGRMVVKQERAIQNLFVMATKKEAQYVPVVVSLHTTTDLEDLTDNVREGLVDQADLDGDASDEIITMSTHYESWDYTIYKRQQGVWQKVYKGGGGGC